MKELTLKEMLEAGVHFGHKTSRWHPKMRQYIFTVRSGIHILDLQRTKEKLEEALNFIKEIISKGGIVLFVGTKIQAKEIVKKEAKRCGMPYVTERWLGGTFTNFRTIKLQLKKLKELEQSRDSGDFKKYTKREQLLFNRKIEELEDKVGGLRNLSSLPECIFIIDTIKDKIAVDEAKKKGVKIVALCDTNSNPEEVDYPIPSNDDATKGIEIMTRAVADAVIEGKELSVVSLEKQEKSKSNKNSKQ